MDSQAFDIEESTGSTVLDQLDTLSQSNRDSVSSFTSTPGRSLSISKKNITPIPANLLPSAPASPPTPAPSPTPHQRPPDWHSADDEENTFLLNLRIHFSTLSNTRKQRLLEGLLDVCDSQQLSFVSSYVGPRLRKDPFLVFPNELCLRVCFLVSPPIYDGSRDLTDSFPRSGALLYRRSEDTCKGIASLNTMAGVT